MHIKKVKNYFSHDFNARNDIKLKKLNMELGMEGIGLYWCIIECLYENNGFLELEQIDLLAYELRVDKNKIEKILENYNLFKKNKKSFYSKSVLKRLEKINEISKKNKENALKRWNKETQTNSNAVALPLETKKKEKKIKENKKNINILINNNITIYDYIEENFGRTLSSLEYEQINLWLEEYGLPNILNAVKVAVMNNARTFRYLEVVLSNGVKQQSKKVVEDKVSDEYETFEYDWLNEDIDEKGRENKDETIQKL